MGDFGRVTGFDNLYSKKEKSRKSKGRQPEEFKAEAVEVPPEDIDTDGNADSTTDAASDTAGTDAADDAVKAAQAAAADFQQAQQPAQPAPEPTPAVPQPVNPTTGVAKATPEPTKEGTVMKYDLSFFETAGSGLYDAIVNKLGVSSELRQAVIDLVTLYPDLRKDVTGLAADLDYQPPAWGWKYQAVGVLKGKTFDSKKAAEEAAEDLLKFKKFEEIFVPVPYYRDKSGKLTKKVPEGTRDYAIITADSTGANTSG